MCFVLQVRNYYRNYIVSEDSVLYILCRTCAAVLDNCSEFQLLLTLYVTYILFPALFCDLINIAERGLAFRGDNELIGSSRNGNYLGILCAFSQLRKCKLTRNDIDTRG